MVRSSSDSSYMSGSPGGSPCSAGAEPQPSEREGCTHSPSLPPGQEQEPCPGVPSRPLQESPPLPESLERDSHPPLRLKKSFEILVRKPTSSKPKPPPRKYFKNDSEPQKKLEEKVTDPSGHTLSTCSQVGGCAQWDTCPLHRAQLLLSIRNTCRSPVLWHRETLSLGPLWRDTGSFAKPKWRFWACQLLALTFRVLSALS